MLKNIWFFLLLCFLLNDSFCLAQQIGKIRNKSIVVSTDVDLRGANIDLPKGFTLEVKGGIIKNGTLIIIAIKNITKSKKRYHMVLVSFLVIFLFFSTFVFAFLGL